MEQRQGEPAKDRDRRAAGIIFRDSLGMRSRSLIFTHINHIDTVLFLPEYSHKMRLPWKRWLDLAAKEFLCIIGWEDGIMPPGPEFDIKKLGAGELRDIAGSYVDNTLNDSDNYEAFSVIRWSKGVWFSSHYNNTILMFHQSNALFPTLIAKRDLFPLL